LEDRDVLLTIAEIATAFAGFATVAAVFSDKVDDATSANVLARFRTLLTYSLLTIVLCLAPFVPHWYGHSTETAWRISSWFLGALVSIVNVAMAFITREARPNVSKLPYIAAYIAWALAAWVPVLLAGMSIAGVGRVSANYLVALVLVLLLAGVAFILVIAAVLKSSR
jgi:hypothetical protein